MVVQDRPNMVFLMKTKNQESVLDRVQKQLNFQSKFVVNALGIAGGLAVLWNNSVDINIEEASRELINLICTDVDSGKTMRITFVHAPNVIQEKVKFWDKLRQVSLLDSSPWLCLGDFNEVLYDWEKVGKRSISQSRLNAFRECLDDCALMEMDCKGCAYTWANNREGENFVKEKLDRVFCNLDWRLLFPTAEAFALVAIGSDHSPLLLDSSIEVVQRRREFRFEAYWNEEAECSKIIKEAWQSPFLENAGLKEKLQVVTRVLTIWSKKKFSNSHHKIESLKKELLEITNNIHVLEEKSKIMSIKQEIETLWRRKEMYWGMRSQINWLKWGDKNTKYFHATTIQRRNRNRVSMLQFPEGEWIRDKNQLQQMTMTYFTDLYTTMGQRNILPILNQISKQVTDEVNETLVTEVTMAEVKTAVFQLGASKAPGPDGLNVLECQNISAVLNQYCYASGQAINLNKSGIFFSKGCPQSLRDNMVRELRIPEISHTGKYLGIPSDWGASKKDMFAWILGRVNSKLEGWKEQLISKAGKEILLKTVVQALPQYAMSIFKIPVSVCKAIEQKIANFWWKNSTSRAGMHWKKWEILKTRKDEGGMGFRDLLTFNKAMLGRQAWRLITNPATLWSKIPKGIYFSQKEFWHAEKGTRPSWGWQSLLVGRDAIANSTMWSIGNGQRVNIREDKWLKRGVIGGPANVNEPKKVAELIDAAEGQWNEQKLEELFDEQTKQEILSIPIQPQETNDELFWKGTKSGCYTVKNGYNIIRQESSKKLAEQPSSSTQTPRALWNSI
ncbi:uncharacterized protein LOC115675253 [Syzygium oleosum]|uniref:uncharacterized protein LOC115675253 n=1 Tax=Syzygium oleosum TaxID=219896 RepID=UPI0024BB4F81|nr:uncharacterized protein LOC115675253 [Syzygium oleosum]